MSRTTTREAEAELQRGLLEAGTLVDEQCATLVRNLTVMARLVADAPKLKAAVDRKTRQQCGPSPSNTRDSFAQRCSSSLGRTGNVLAETGDLDIAEGVIGRLPEIQQALAGREASGFWPHADGVLQVMAVPITIVTAGLDRPDIMGSLTVGFRLDNALAAQFKRATESDIAFAVDGHIRASTLPAADRGQLVSLLKTGGVQAISLSGRRVRGAETAPDAGRLLLE